MPVHCICCLEAIADGERSEALQCGHVFHEECIRKYKEIQGIADVYELRCPTCKMSGKALEKLSKMPSSWANGGSPPLDDDQFVVSDDCAPQPDEVGQVVSPARTVVADTAIVEVGQVAPHDYDTARVSVCPVVSDAQELPPGQGRPMGSDDGDPEPGEVAPAVPNGPVPTPAPTELVPAASSGDDGMTMPMMTQAAQEGFKIELVHAWTTPQQVLCCDCREPCVSYRVRSKGQGTFVCNQCAYVHTRLYRTEGAGYRAQLCTISTEDLTEFFKKAKTMNAKDQKALLNSCMEKFSTRERTYMYGGMFKPLSAWQNDGYDPTIIATKSLPQDVMPDRMWGLVYRVPLLSINDQGSDGQRHSSAACAQAKPTSLAKRLKLLAPKGERQAAEGDAGEDADPGAEEPSEATSDSSLDSSDATSNERNKDKKKEMKKAVKEMCKTQREKEKQKEKAAKEKAEHQEACRKQREDRKQAAKQQRLDRKAAALAAKTAAIETNAAKAKVKATCTALAKKLDTAIGGVEKTLRTPGSQCLPDGVRTPLVDALAELTKSKAYAEGFLFGDEDWTTFEEPTDTQRLLDTAKKHEAVFRFNVRTFRAK